VEGKAGWMKTVRQEEKDETNGKGHGYVEWIKNYVFEGKENVREMKVSVKSLACYI